MFFPWSSYSTTGGLCSCGWGLLERINRIQCRVRLSTFQTYILVPPTIQVYFQLNVCTWAVTTSPVHRESGLANLEHSQSNLSSGKIENWAEPLPDGIANLSLHSRNLLSTSQSAEKPMLSTNHRASFQNAVLLLVNFKLCILFIKSFMHSPYQKSCGQWMINLEPKSPIFTAPSCYLASVCICDIA